MRDRETERHIETDEEEMEEDTDRYEGRQRKRNEERLIDRWIEVYNRETEIYGVLESERDWGYGGKQIDIVGQRRIETGRHRETYGNMES